MTGRSLRVTLGVALLFALLATVTTGLMGGGVRTASAAPSASPSAGPVTLRLGWVQDVDNLNPFIGYGSSYEVWCLNYDFLVGYAEDGSPRPAIAESWETAQGGRVWTFHIRHGVRWQDGLPLTARDVAFSINYVVDNDLSSYATYAKFIRRAVVVDPYTVRVHCTRPKANMLRLYIYVLPEHIWSKVDPKKVETSYPNSPPIMGSGPFQCVEWKKGEYVRMKANPSYWGGAPHVDEVIFAFYTNPDVMAQDLRSGQLDGAVGLPSAQFAGLSKDPELEATPYNLLNWEYLSFNCYTDPASQGAAVLRDVRFRRALSWGIDRAKCAALGWGGYARPGTTVLPPDEWPADFNAHWQPSPAQTIGFDLAKARRLLDEAGYRDTDGDGIREYGGAPIVLRLWARSDSTASQIQGKLIAGWFSKIGLRIRFSVIDPGALSDALYATKDNGNVYAPDYDMYLWDAWGYMDPGDTLSSYVTDQIWNWNDPCWSNGDYDRLSTQQYGAMDAQKRLALLYRMQQIFYEQAPMVVLDYPDTLEAVDTSRWEGWVRFMGGPAFYSSFNMDSYLQVQPKATATHSGGASTWWLAALTAAIAAALVALWLALGRRRGRAEEE